MVFRYRFYAPNLLDFFDGEMLFMASGLLSYIIFESRSMSNSFDYVADES